MPKDSYRSLRDREPSKCCPACGGAVADSALRVDLQTNTLSANGMIIIVQPRTAELVHVLLQRFPNFVPREIIISKVWANSALDRTVDAQATRARLALKKIGYGIECSYGSGYRIFREQDDVALPTLASFVRVQPHPWAGGRRRGKPSPATQPVPEDATVR